MRCGKIFVASKLILPETKIRPITCIVWKYHLQLYGHVECYKVVDPAHKVVSEGVNP